MFFCVDIIYFGVGFVVFFIDVLEVVFKVFFDYNGIGFGIVEYSYCFELVIKIINEVKVDLVNYFEFFFENYEVIFM